MKKGWILFIICLPVFVVSYVNSFLFQVKSPTCHNQNASLNLYLHLKMFNTAVYLFNRLKVKSDFISVFGNRDLHNQLLVLFNVYNN
jgi:hypothetical protein